MATGGSRTIIERGGGHWWAWTWKQSEFLMIWGPVGGGGGDGGGDASMVVSLSLSLSLSMLSLVVVVVVFDVFW